MAFSDAATERTYVKHVRDSRARTDWMGLGLQAVLWVAGLGVMHSRFPTLPRPKYDGILDGGLVAAASAFFAALALWCPPLYRRHRNAAIVLYHIYSMAWPTMRLVLEALPAGKVADASPLPITLLTSSGALRTLSLALSLPLPLPLNAALVVAHLVCCISEHRSMCGLPYLQAAQPERLFARVHSAVLACLPLGPLGLELRPERATPKQACAALFAATEVVVAACALLMLYWMERHSRARFLRGLPGTALPNGDAGRRSFDLVAAGAQVALVLPAAVGTLWGLVLLVAHFSPP